MPTPNVRDRVTKKSSEFAHQEMALKAARLVMRNGTGVILSHLGPSAGELNSSLPVGNQRVKGLKHHPNCGIPDMFAEFFRKQVPNA
jgi:hypothetical protein